MKKNIIYTVITFAEVNGQLLARVERQEYKHTYQDNDVSPFYVNLTEYDTTARALWLTNAVKTVDPKLAGVIARNEKGVRDDLKPKRKRGVKVRLTNARGASAELDAARVRELMEELEEREAL